MGVGGPVQAVLESTKIYTFSKQPEYLYTKSRAEMWVFSLAALCLTTRIYRPPERPHSPKINFEKANEEIPFESWKLKVRGLQDVILTDPPFRD